MFEQIGKILKKYDGLNINKDDIKKDIVKDFMHLNDFGYKVYMSMTKRSQFDIEIKNDDKHYMFDIKVYNENSSSSVSNLMSINRIKNTLENNSEIYFIFIKHVDGVITDIQLQPIYSLKWSYILIQNLGKGQMQIKNLSNYTSYDTFKTKEIWLSEFKDRVLTYYDKLILKITENKSDWKDAFVDN